MGGGQSSSAPSTQEVIQKSEIPQYLQDFAQKNISLAQDIAARPYQTYPGQRVAGLGDLQNAGIGMTAANAGNLSPAQAQFYGATYNLDNIAGRSYSGAPVNPGSVSVGNLNPSAVAPWMSPYVEQALQPQLQDIQRQGALSAQSIGQGATSAGAFGDARLGIQQAENTRNTNQIASNAIGTGYQNAYASALGAAQNAFGQNTQAQLGAFGANTQAQLGAFNANAGQYNADRAAQMQANLAIPGIQQAGYGLTQQAASDLYGAGQQQQQVQQQGLDLAYQDFLNQFEYPQEMLNMLLATGAGQPYSTTRLTTTPYSSSAQNLGALAALFGLGGKLGGVGGTA
jgi:hypothetical protein